MLVYWSCDFPFAILQVGGRFSSSYLHVLPIPFPRELGSGDEGSTSLDIRSEREFSSAADLLKLVTC